MTEKSTTELYKEWREATAQRRKLQEELGFVFREVEGRDIEAPPKALTPETAAELKRLEDEEARLKKQYEDKLYGRV